MCTAAEINANVKELQELRRMREELDAEIESIEDVLKQHMKDTGKYEIDALTGRVTWLESTSNRFDATAMKRELPDLYGRYCKPVTTRYFRLQK